MPGFDDLYRRAVLATADARWFRGFVERNGWRLGVGRFVAGPDLASALPKLQAIEASGKGVIIDVLGEFVTSEEAARQSAARVAAAVDGVHAAGVEPYFSVKPTQLGLGVSSDLALELADDLARRVGAVGGTLCLDMESSGYVDGTLALYLELRRRGHDHVATVLQSYLRRTPADLERLLTAAPRPTLRVVKGAYKESPDVALGSKREVADAFMALVARGLAAGAHVDVATHDERLLERALAHVDGAGLGPEAYGVQMLYGVRPHLQDRLAAAGRPLRLYVPFGDDWYGYYSRRLAERPANLAFVLRGLFG
ncbi:MAG TPA: proline dehydrogenase family protein [Trueperaceae bacterium]|nr:proline dehydrogenase family protein [Trueperaceae bacterium]